MMKSVSFEKPAILFLLWAFISVHLHCTSYAFLATNLRNAHQTSKPKVHLEESTLCVRRPILCQARSSRAATINHLEEIWFPPGLVPDSFASEAETVESFQESFQQKSIRLMAELIKKKMKTMMQRSEEIEDATGDCKVSSLARGRFVDLCYTLEGERILEALFQDSALSDEETPVIQGAIISLQSLLVLATQFGLKVTTEQFERSVSHLIGQTDEIDVTKDLVEWDGSSTKRLKYRNNRAPALQLLAELKWKRSAQGAYELLVKLGAWQKHEDLALLRSGFPLRFSEAEMEAAVKASENTHDPDGTLGIRRDFRHQKVYTIDGASTSEIDDGLGVEVLKGEGGSEVLKIWIHIADADHWAPRGSELFQVAKKRGTSLYLPQATIPMLPSVISSQEMSLTANKDVFALSLGVVLREDGSIDESTLDVTSSVVRVTYRLTYDDVDEMLEDGVGYDEEWPLGALYTAASLRRKYRINNGSSEGLVPTQIPQFSMSTFPDRNAPDGIGISADIQVSHNSGKNQSAVVESMFASNPPSYEAPVSSASTLVTEMMILAGEAIGKWKLKNQTLPGLRLPFRSQPKPDYRSRAREKTILTDLMSNNVGGGYCHAWYARRFLNPVKVEEIAACHSGLGLDCYAQWTSPIRRFGDLQVHSAVKRHLRRQRLVDILKVGGSIPPALTPLDLGCDISTLSNNEAISKLVSTTDDDLDYSEGSSLVGVARRLQRSSQLYWMLEFVSRLKDENPGKVFEGLVLGCTNPTRRQYAIYIYELGLEWKYISPVGLQAGNKLRLKIASTLPHNGQLTFTRVNA